jgi:hypothetical protein
MNQDLTKQVKAENRRRQTSGGWIPPTEEGHSAADQSGFKLLEAVIALLIMLIVALGVPQACFLFRFMTILAARE